MIPILICLTVFCSSFKLVKCATPLHPKLRQIKFAPFDMVCYDYILFYVLHFADLFFF